MTTGEGAGYHAITIGIFMDELIKRVDPKHRNISTFLRDEVCQPFGNFDFVIC